MIKAVLFDLDGTLLDRDASVRVFIDKQYERLNDWVGHITKEEYALRFIELDSKGYVWKDKVYQQMVCEFNIKHLTWESLLQDYINEFKHSCVPYPNLFSMLETLKNKSIRLGIITNGYGQFQMDNIRALGIEDYFDIILVSEWEEIKKPNPDIFKRALNRLQVLPNQSIYVGDHPENDINGAKNIGMIGIWKRDEHWKNAELDYMIEDLNDLPTIINEVEKDLESRFSHYGK